MFLRLRGYGGTESGGVMPLEEWEAYDSEPCDDPDNWEDEAE